jgi:DNA-binding transcriptional LysR family regulator
MTFDQEPRSDGHLPAADGDPFCSVKLTETTVLQQWAARRVAMTLNQFSFFAVVAKHRSLTKASAELRVSQPSITQQLKQLENHHGAKLYRRLSKGIEMTEAGQLFLRKITPILDQVAELEAASKPRAQRIRREVLRVGGSDSASAVLLPSLLAGFRQRHPAVGVEMSTGVSDQLEHMVLNAVVEIAMTVRRAVSTELTCEPYRREKVVMFVPANHRFAKRGHLKLSDVLAEALIVSGGTGAASVVDKAVKQIRDEGVEFKIAMYCDGPTAIKAGVRQEMGVGIAYEDAVQAEVASGEFKILKVAGLELAGESFIVYSKKRPLSPAAREFLELLRRARIPTL